MTRAYAPEAGIVRDYNLDHRATVPEYFLAQNPEQELRGYLPAMEIGLETETDLVADYAPVMEIDPAMGTDLVVDYAPVMEIDPAMGTDLVVDYVPAMGIVPAMGDRD